MLERVSLHKKHGLDADFSVASLCQMFQNCPRLRDLELGELNDEILECIGQKVSQLEVLRLNDYCGERTTVGWLAFAKGHMYPLLSPPTPSYAIPSTFSQPLFKMPSQDVR